MLRHLDHFLMWMEFVLTYISMRYLELLHSRVSQAVKTALPEEMITSFRERRLQECFEEENVPSLLLRKQQGQHLPSDSPGQSLLMFWE